MRLVTLTTVCLLVFVNLAFAINIKNIKTTTDGSTINVTYDLFGKPGERNANVKFAIVLDGERYLPGTIKVIGDFGNQIPVGLGKKISWDLLKDMPAGYKGSIKIELDAESSASNDPFNVLGTKSKPKPPIVSDETVTDPSTKLMWVRSPLSINPVTSIDDAIYVAGKMNSSNYLGYSDWRIPRQDDFKSLVTLIEMYGYTYRQSTLPYLAKVGFNIPKNTKFWTIDKSAVEFVGKQVFISSGGTASASGTSNRSTYASTPLRGGGRYTKNTDVSASVSGSNERNYAVREKADDSGTYDVIFVTADGNYQKHMGAEPVHVLAVRGNSSLDVYAYSTNIDVSISP
jgi:hypothetical protein